MWSSLAVSLSLNFICGQGRWGEPTPGILLTSGRERGVTVTIFAANILLPPSEKTPLGGSRWGMSLNQAGVRLQGFLLSWLPTLLQSQCFWDCKREGLVWGRGNISKETNGLCTGTTVSSSSKSVSPETRELLSPAPSEGWASFSSFFSPRPLSPCLPSPLSPPSPQQILLMSKKAQFSDAWKVRA